MLRCYTFCLGDSVTIFSGLRRVPAESTARHIPIVHADLDAADTAGRSFRIVPYTQGAQSDQGIEYYFDCGDLLISNVGFQYERESSLIPVRGTKASATYGDHQTCY